MSVFISKRDATTLTWHKSVTHGPGNETDSLGAKGNSWQDKRRAPCRPVARGSRQVAEDRRDCYWLYVVTRCKTEPCLQEPIKNPARFPWHEVKKVDHYYLSVDALT